MPDWKSTTEITKDEVVFSRLVHVLLGLYIWEWFTSLDFDWDYIRAKRQFRWPLIFYFLNRYCLLVGLVGTAIALNVTTEINCQALYTFNLVIGAAATGLASINLSLRTMAVWAQRWYIVVPLILLILGQWSLLFHGATHMSRTLVKSTYEPEQGCVIAATYSGLLLAASAYTMGLEFVVLSFTAWKLVIGASSSEVRMGRSKLVVLIFGDGLIYFIIAFVFNFLVTIFMSLNLNPAMSIIANVPSAVGSTIAACRAVRRLVLFDPSGSEMFGSTKVSTLAFCTNTSASVRPPRKSTLKLEGVQMNTFESESPSLSGATHINSTYDSMSKIQLKQNSSSPAEEYDLEAQEIHDESQHPPCLK
ncbi:hypothetical protein EV360DRAFT_86388 [Lentinula raphanica]|nr:hypothetical protein EV360DRAFT_86388 [Lentinula raphanica]